MHRDAAGQLHGTPAEFAEYDELRQRKRGVARDSLPIPIQQSSQKPTFAEAFRATLGVDRNADPTGLVPKIRALSHEKILEYVRENPDAGAIEAMWALFGIKITGGLQGKIVYDTMFGRLAGAKKQLGVYPSQKQVSP
jgi:hypothetical protein